MATTSRHQALHDWLTHSTVQIRDTATARPIDYVGARAELPASDRPSRGRRFVVAISYLLLGWLAIGTLTGFLISRTCMIRDVCSSSEEHISQAIGVIGLIFAAIIITQAWRGKLYGARLRKTDMTPA